MTIWLRYLGFLLLAPLATPAFVLGVLAALTGYGVQMAWALGLVTYPLVLLLALASDLLGRLLAHGRPGVHGVVGLFGGLVAFALLDGLFEELLETAIATLALVKPSDAVLTLVSLLVFLLSSWISMAIMRRNVPRLRTL